MATVITLSGNSDTADCNGLSNTTAWKKRGRYNNKQYTTIPWTNDPQNDTTAVLDLNNRCGNTGSFTLSLPSYTTNTPSNPTPTTSGITVLQSLHCAG
jgi:hypothetical protein